MGHNMGMLHDFDETHGGDNGPCNGQGFLSYGSAPQQWSTCSKNDFLALYNSIVNSNNKYWCLPYADTACGSAPSPPPPSPSPPSPSPPSPSPPAGSCATMPQFMQDANRIVGGEAAPSMIPWQVAMLSNGWQFCGGKYAYFISMITKLIALFFISKVPSWMLVPSCLLVTVSLAPVPVANLSELDQLTSTAVVKPEIFPKSFGTLPIPTTVEL